MTVPMVTLPSVASLVSALASPESDGRQWLPLGAGYSARFYRRGSAALVAGIEATRKRMNTEEVTVWVPDYFCNEPLESVRQRGFRLRFYPIKTDLAPDFESLTQLMDGASGSQVFVLVHYFGFPNVTSQAREFCDRHGMVLFEDSAHMLRAGAGASQGDLIIFSPRKVLPLPSGGLLLAQEKFVTTIDSCGGVSDWRETVSWALRRLLQKILWRVNFPWHKLRNYEDLNTPDDASTRSEHERGEYNSYAMKLLKVIEVGIQEAIDRRRENYQRMARLIEGMNRLRPLFPGLAGDVCPYAFPIMVEGGCEPVVRRLNASGIMASRWPDLPPEVIASRDQHEMAFRIYDQLILLPIHQSLRSKDMEAIGSAVQHAIEAA